MSKPLFSVGEGVILDSKSRPYLNGDCVVEGIYFSGDINPLNGKQVHYYDGRWGYALSIRCPSKNLWDESAIRKKYKPGRSFSELMKHLKGGIHEQT